MTSDTRGLTGRLAEFLSFVGDARAFLKQAEVSKHHPDVQRIRAAVEESYRDDRGQPAVYQKYESALYEDAPAIVALWRFFESYDRDLLQRFHALTNAELSGLRGDYHPMAILGRSVLGTGALLMGGITVWWGLIKLVSIEDTGNLFTELLHDLLSPEMVNRLVGVIWLVGMFVVIWYTLRMVRNRRQVAFLSSLARALELYLDEMDSHRHNE